MSNNTHSLRLDNVKFRASKKLSYPCLCFADATVVVEGALPDGSDFRLRLRSILLKKFRSGHVRIDFKAEAGSDGEYYPIVFPHSRETRELLTALLFEEFAAAVESELVDQV